MATQVHKPTGAASLFLVITLVNAGNYLLNVALGRVLGPEIFAEAGILATLVLVLSFIATGIQVSVAQFTAGVKAEHPGRDQSGFLKWAMRAAAISGAGFALLTIACSGGIRSFLQFDHLAPIILLACGIPIYFIMSVQRGYLQGLQEMKTFASSYVAEMLGRLLVTAVLLYVAMRFGYHLTSEAVAAGFIASFISGCLASTPKVGRGSFHPDPIFYRSITRMLSVVLFYECAQIIISYSDTLLVKHYHESEVAGWYTALSLIGKAVYFATWSVVMLLIPKVIELQKKGQPHNGVFFRYFSFVAGIGLAITLVCLAVPETIVRVIFGAEYLPVAPLLWKYAAATLLFACANVFTYYYMVLERYFPVLLCGIAGLLQVFFINEFYSTVTQVVHVQIIIMAGLLLCMLAFHLVNKKYYEEIESSYRLALSSK